MRTSLRGVPLALGGANEALDAGAIPLLEKDTFSTISQICLDHPIPTLYNWRGASALLRKPPRLLELQRKVSEWWNEEKVNRRARLSSFLEERFGEERTTIGNPAHGIPFTRLSQYIELLRHQNAYAMIYRVKRIESSVLKHQSLVRHGKGRPVECRAGTTNERSSMFS